MNSSSLPHHLQQDNPELQISNIRPKPSETEILADCRMTCQLTARSGDAEFCIKCTWHVVDYEYFRSVNITFQNTKSTGPQLSTGNAFRFFASNPKENTQEVEVTQDSVGSVEAFRFFTKALLDANYLGSSSLRLGGLIIPSKKGHCVRSDIISLRLVDCELFESIESFAGPQQYFFGDAVKEDASILEIFLASAGGFLVQADTRGPQAIFLSVEKELINRLSFLWLIEQKPGGHTLAIVEGGRTKAEHGGIAASIYPAAKALGIRMVVLDNPGHWLEGASYEEWREAFLPVELESATGDLSQLIVDALRNYGKEIDGIVTFCDSYQPAVARAAIQLSLPTSAPQAFETATNKYESSLSEGHDVYRGFNMNDANRIAGHEKLKFPLVVKPCKGWGSEGVYKVENVPDLLNAIKSIDSVRHGTEFVVEEYCDGPEVDVNMVVYDGELLFHEISDDYPKSAEGNAVGTLNTFIEMDSVHPSNLPLREQEMLRDSFLRTVRRLGLNNGVFHIEGRVHNSTMAYRVDGNQIRDLETRKVPSSVEPSAWLLDLNPRPPGMTASLAPQTTYGIDYHALSLLIALRDSERVYALTRPFKLGPQYWCVMVYIPTEFPLEKRGVFDSNDICAELTQRRPDLAAHISSCLCLVAKGEVVPHPSSGVNTWVAYFNVYSRTSRRHALELAQEVRRETHFSFL